MKRYQQFCFDTQEEERLTIKPLGSYTKLILEDKKYGSIKFVISGKTRYWGTENYINYGPVLSKLKVSPEEPISSVVKHLKEAGVPRSQLETMQATFMQEEIDLNKFFEIDYWPLLHRSKRTITKETARKFLLPLLNKNRLSNISNTDLIKLSNTAQNGTELLVLEKFARMLDCYSLGKLGLYYKHPSAKKSTDFHKRRKRVPSPQETRKIVQAMTSVSNYKEMVILLAATGMRIGELYNLRPQDVSLGAHGTLTLVSDRSCGGRKAHTKNSSTPTTYALTSLAAEFRDEALNVLQTMVEAGPEFKLCCTTQHSFGVAFRRAAMKAEVDNIVVHDLRRGWCAMKKAEGYNKYQIANMLQEDVMTIIKHYL